MALALYRKYRPATFAEVVGQEHVTEPLRTALAAGRINHAYLFSGPRGCGKTSSARIMARSLNCVQGPTPDPCGECGPCQALAPEGPGSVDVTELDAASHGGVDDARELRDRAFYAPAESRYRIFIIDEAHMVTTQGFNALLKIVEEPPEHLIFIFATTEPEKVLTTIRSRTHHYPFRLIPPTAMRELLERNVAAEGVAVDPAVYPLIIRAGGGSARDTQSVLDQLLAGAGPEGVDYRRTVALLGVTDVALLDDMIDALAADDSAEVFGTIERLTDAGHDPRRFATDLLDRLRDLILLRSVPDAANKGLVNAPEEELTRMAAQSGRIGLATLSRYAEIVHNGLLEMRGATAPRLLLELLVARMLLPGAADGEEALLQRLERLERRATIGATSPSQPAPPSPEPKSVPASSASRSQSRASEESQPPAPPSTPAPPAPVVKQVDQEKPAESTAPLGDIDVVALRQVWPQLRETLRKTPGARPTEAMLDDATVQELEGSTVVIGHTAEALVRRLSESRNIDHISEAFYKLLGVRWQIRIVHATQKPKSTPPLKQESVQPQQPSTAEIPPKSTMDSLAEKSADSPQPVNDTPLPKPVPSNDVPPPMAPEASGPVGEEPEPWEAEAEEMVIDAPDSPLMRASALLTTHLGARPLDQSKM